MSNTLRLERWDSSPDYWKKFVKYVESVAVMHQWIESEGGPGSYSYELICKILKEEWNCKFIVGNNKLEIQFPTSKHKLLFQIKYG